MGIKEIIDKFQLSTFSQERNGLGLDFSDRHLRSLSIEVDSGKIFSKFLKSESLAEGILRDGKILKKELLTEKLKSIKQEAHNRGVSLADSKIVVSVPQSRIFFKIFKLSSSAKKAKVEKAVLRKADNYSPFEGEQSYFDFDLLSTNRDYKEVLYVAVPKKIIEDYRSVANKAGLEIGVFEPEFISLARAFRKVFKGQKNGIIFDCGRRTTTISIILEGSPQKLESINLAGKKFNQVIANDLEIPKKKAKKLRKEKGLESKRVRKALAPVLNSMVNQFTEILDQFKKDRNSRPEFLLLTGGSALMPGFENYFEKNLNLEVLRPDPFSANKIEVAEKKLNESKTKYATLIGATMRARDNSSGLPLINFIGN